jgi:hypothetical protein
MLPQSSSLILVKVLISALILLSARIVDSFAIHRQMLISNVRNGSPFAPNSEKLYVASPLKAQNDLFADLSVTIRTDVAHNNIPTIVDNQVFDKNGREFSVDGLVRVCVNGLKAYQVNGKGQGSYNELKEFVPDTSDEKKKCLLLPEGLRGRVVKVYDEDVVSANLPIVVLFTPGKDTEEGYDAPTAFRMHFTPQELEFVE